MVLVALVDLEDIIVTETDLEDQETLMDIIMGLKILWIMMGIKTVL